MDQTILKQISLIIRENKELLKIPIRQKAKFEGWLKFELANRLELIGMENVEVESQNGFGHNRADISFFYNERYYQVELKTSNTNWKIEGVSNNSRPITKNIKSIVKDAKKLNSTQGIVSFVLFPIPPKDDRWKIYIERIKKETKIDIDYNKNCKLEQVNIDNNRKCELLICSFLSRKFDNWR
ncbi:hypothetical protein [Poritiphilus flavus]|uniref:Uncharacterized protein n=1 Tax=Poritiphilus flavus TaxID=2697053 RepID=A0A6L9ECI6_9FLAO|nr:hypothetical protein [Poritiphilus flavus]NAS12248.1 hypothetical protein [Poritiphilus flavus]